VFFKNYEYFLTIAEEGSISKAAEKLYVTQPSLSKYLKRMEENLGVELFSRDSYPLKLTEAGQVYKTYLDDIRIKEKQLQRDFAEYREGLYGTVSLALTEWRGGVILPVLLPYFKKRYPHIQVKVLEGSHQQMASWLEHDKVDFALMHQPNSFQGIEMEVLAQENVLFVVNGGEPLLEQISCRPPLGEVGNMSADDFRLFKDEPFILGGEGQNIRQVTDTFLNSLNIVPKVAFVVKGNWSTQNLVRVGIGNGFAARAAFGLNHYRKDLCYFTLGDPPLHWNLVIANKRGHVLSIQAQKLAQAIRDLASGKVAARLGFE
jgi:LysR family transcriptional activator of glutamate synthase operon